MVTVYFPPLRHLGRGLPRQIKPSPWLSPYPQPESRRSSEARYTLTSKRTTNAAAKVEDFTLHVDASGIGIGITLGGKESNRQWQRWSFDGTLGSIPRSPKTGEINPQWAELSAAYAGLQTVVEGGFHARSIVLYSDNSAIVMLLGRLVDVHPSLWGTVGRPPRLFVDLLKRIGEVCEKHGLKIKPQWLPTGENPADGPSRGRGLLEDERIRYGRYLQDDLEGTLVGV